MQKGRLFILSGPSAVGKGTVVKALMQQVPTLRLSISCTSRDITANEQEGVDYFFKTNEEFEQMIRDDAFLEYAGKFGRYYGTPRTYVEKMLGDGYDIMLEIDPQGCFQVLKKMPEAVSIFLLPPSRAELIDRIVKRNRDTEEKMRERIAKADEDIAVADKYRYCFVNDDLDVCIARVLNVIRGGEEKSDLEQLKEIRKEFEEAHVQ